ncbi:MAG TPA: hypothetical protein VFD23_05350 [Clostridia bacterium]|nr:hypothetical protein [Clostridia bacterium]
MKMAKRTLSMALALIMAIGMFSIASSSAPAPADYTAVENAITTNLPSVANRYFYTDEATGLIDDVLASINWGLNSEDQSLVDGYVAMVNDLGTLLGETVTDGSQSPLVFAYNGGYSFSYVYPYGTSGLNFYPFRDEQKAVNTVALEPSKSAVPMVSRYVGDQNFTVTLSLGSNALLAGGSIPVLFDKTRLEIVDVDNLANNVNITPTMLGENLAQEYDFFTTLNPAAADFWPTVYQNDAAFKAQWGAISIMLTTNFDNGAPYSVVPEGQEDFLSIQFKVKAGAPAGDALVYVDPNFKRDAYNTSNSLYFGRAKDAAAFVPFDALSAYGAAINLDAALATVEVVDVILGDTDLNEEITARDALMALQFSAGNIVLSDKQLLQANVYLGASEPAEVTSRDVLMILQFSAGKITSF